MTVKVTMANGGSDSVDFINNAGTTLAQVKGYDDGSSNGHLELYTTASGTASEKVRVDKDGNVGIGTSSPLYKLHVGAGADSPVIAATTIYASNNGSTIITARDSTNDVESYIGSYSTGTWLGSATNHPAIFTTNNTERARINANGSVGIGVAGQSAISGISGFLSAKNTANDGSWGLALEQTGTSNCRGIGMAYGYAPNNTFAEFCYFLDTSAVRFVVRSNGGIANYSANNVNLSDERTKTNIVDAGNYLDKICAIPVRTFKYKDQTDNLLNLGVIAQEVETVAPELVDMSGFGETPEDGVPLKAIYQTDLQYALMKCIQEQQALINAQQATLTTLTESFATLTARIESLEAK